MKGRLIIFDGIDGSGKTTYAKYFSKKLNGIYLKEPKYYRKEIFQDIPSLAELFLFLAQRNRVYLEIKKFLNQGKLVILDRSFPSTLAYQLKAKNLEKIISLKDYLFLDKIARNFLEPDKIFIFDLPVNQALKRIKRKRTKFEEEKFLKKVRKAYLELSKKFNWQVIDASSSKKELISQLLVFLSNF